MMESCFKFTQLHNFLSFLFKLCFQDVHKSFTEELNRVNIEGGTADLLIVIGDIPEGPLSDKLTRTPLDGAGVGRKYEDGGRLGVVLLNSQPIESCLGRSTLILYSDPVKILRNVLLSMNIDIISEVPRLLPCQHLDKAIVPYNHAGRRSQTENILLNFQVKNVQFHFLTSANFYKNK